MWRLPPESDTNIALAAAVIPFQPTRIDRFEVECQMLLSAELHLVRRARRPAINKI